jgi:signal transduction histidine kinase
MLAPVKKVIKFQTDNRLLSGYFIAFALLLVSYLLTLYSNHRLIKQSKMVNHTYKVITSLENILSVVKDGETGLRGYVNTKDTVFLAPFYKSLQQHTPMCTILRTEVADDVQQQTNAALLEKSVDNKYRIMEASLQYFIEHGYIMDSNLMRVAYQGKAAMDSIRSIVAVMQDNEKQLLVIRNNDVDSRHATVNTVVIVSLILAFIFSAFGIITFLKENKARKIADTKVENYQRELKERIVQLNDANKELVEMRRQEKFASTGRLARMIAHEVRNPLTNIDLALSQLKDDIPVVTEDTAMMFDMIGRNSVRINQLITDLLNATRFTDLQFKKISVNVLLDEALTLAKDRIGLGKVTIIKNYETDICDVEVDSEKIKIAFLNLIINAIEAMGSDNENVLTLTTKNVHNKCVVTVADNGSGMDATALSKLFEPYYTTKSKGNGLGLTNTQNIILNHKGSIDAESTPGKGTSFTIEFNFAS